VRCPNAVAEQQRNTLRHSALRAGRRSSGQRRQVLTVNTAMQPTPKGGAVATKHDLPDWVHGALKDLGGRARLVEVARGIWKRHESELRKSGDLFYTWQYDMRWAANRLRRAGIMRAADVSPSGVWELA